MQPALSRRTWLAHAACLSGVALYTGSRLLASDRPFSDSPPTETHLFVRLWQGSSSNETLPPKEAGDTVPDWIRSAAAKAGCDRLKPLDGWVQVAGTDGVLYQSFLEGRWVSLTGVKQSREGYEFRVQGHGIDPQAAPVTISYADSTRRVIPLAVTAESEPLFLACYVGEASPDAGANTVRNAELLRQNLDNFELRLDAFGPQDKPFYSVWLQTGEDLPPVPHPFLRGTRITRKHAERLIELAARDGLLADVRTLTTSGNGYRLEMLSGGHVVTCPLGWNLKMLAQIERLGKIVEDNGDAAQSFAMLLGRMSGYRRMWEAEGQTAAAKGR